MCSILGYTGSRLSIDDFEKSLLKTKSRGPDLSRIVKLHRGYLGFNRLSIMGLSDEGMQPFVFKDKKTVVYKNYEDNNYLLNSDYDCALVCNGELYGFRQLKEMLIDKGYEFISDSDCEILPALYKEYGVKMFAMLDSEFALVLYDKKKDIFVAARDPIGIRPLYYGVTEDGEYIFASEPKNITGVVDKIKPFPPGHYFYDGEFVCFRDMSKVDTYSSDGLEDILVNIHDLLIKSVTKRLDSDSKIGFLLSGGLDSSLVCGIAAKASDKPIDTWAIGMYLLCQAIHRQSDNRVILTGEISDEIFGYKYTDFAPSAEEFQKESEKRIREIHMYDVLRADRCISVNSLEARVPFGDLDFVDYCMSISPDKKMNHYGMGKYLLRKAFEEDKLIPDSILWREKAAFSDAVGHSMVDYLKEYAQSRYTDTEFEELRLKYSHAQPFTKESLLYREIFEKYYPGQARMILRRSPVSSRRRSAKSPSRCPYRHIPKPARRRQSYTLRTACRRRRRNNVLSFRKQPPSPEVPGKPPSDA